VNLIGPFNETYPCDTLENSQEAAHTFHLLWREQLELSSLWSRALDCATRPELRVIMPTKAPADYLEQAKRELSWNDVGVYCGAPPGETNDKV
jgi:hypothetical protein